MNLEANYSKKENFCLMVENSYIYKDFLKYLFTHLSKITIINEF